MVSKISIIFESDGYMESLGNTNQNLAFEYGDGAMVYDGCGVTLNGIFWYFGGSGTNKKVS